jgi:hypothetical protein
MRRVLPLLLHLSAFVPAAAGAAATVRIDDSRSLSIALALRSSVGGTSALAPDGSSRLLDASVDGAVIALGGELDKKLKIQLNVFRVPTGEFRLMDGIVMVDVLPALQIWAGRMLPPTDRLSLTGPFFGVAWEMPFVSAYPSNNLAGREDGVAVWGSFLEGRARYQIGGFRGRVGGPNRSAFPLVAARASYSLWDPEPGYYAAGTYLGAKKILTLGIHGRFQQDAVATMDGGAAPYAGYGADFLLEHEVGPVVATVEAGASRYDARGAGEASIFEGYGWYGALAGLWAAPIGPGRVQLGVRYQRLQPSAGPMRNRFDGTVNYLVAGQTIRLSGTGSREVGPDGAPVLSARFGVQLIL